ncbi:formylglycine-generating enzyme family protein [Novipirellula artificiosorum]|uniref:Serine/threonine-protein kinase pkn1 n=1 Tax=Novipirellula artificiosorum TaxID=2528016 RepID=A0A5C6E261_9BACT|nr:formylglycine-generating enzyme family protein [Novipirellula artificiosorum]TWU41761.1 Serine/threonine-protein kinase pkn1 [Novipirellula artificiosorum]
MHLAPPPARSVFTCILVCFASLSGWISTAISTAEDAVLPLPEAVATSEAEMKPYLEPIEHTEQEIAMVPIPGGTFRMGSPDTEADRNEDEGPQREVTIDPFWMGKCEITWDQYDTWGLQMDQLRRRMMSLAATPRDALVDGVSKPTEPYTDMSFGMGKEQFPAICMTQHAARTYCKWLSVKTGRYYRLPTEAEWEYAARAGTQTAYSFGDDPADLDDYAWYFDNSDDTYHEVGQKQPNPWGLHDMHGNVAEWVLDQYVEDFYSQSEKAKNPLAIPNTLFPRVVRGGGWDDDPEMLRCAVREGSSEAWKEQDPQLPQSIWYLTDALGVGFRVVRPLVEPSDQEKAEKWGKTEPLQIDQE